MKRDKLNGNSFGAFFLQTSFQKQPRRSSAKNNGCDPGGMKGNNKTNCLVYIIFLELSMRGWEGTMKWGSCSNWLGLGLNLKHDKTTGWRINLNSFRRFLGQSTETSAPAARVHSQHVVQSLVLFNFVLGGNGRAVHYHTPWTSGTALGREEWPKKHDLPKV